MNWQKKKPMWFKERDSYDQSLRHIIMFHGERHSVSPTNVGNQSSGICWPPQRGCFSSSLRSLCRLTPSRVSASLIGSKRPEVWPSALLESAGGRTGGRPSKMEEDVTELLLICALCFFMLWHGWLAAREAALCIEAPAETWQNFFQPPRYEKVDVLWHVGPCGSSQVLVIQAVWRTEFLRAHSVMLLTTYLWCRWTSAVINELN